MGFIRKAHRWLAPLFVLALIAVVVTGLPQPATPAQMVQQVLMLFCPMTPSSMVGKVS